MSSIMGKAMGPLMTAASLALAYPTAGASLSMLPQGLSMMTQPGGVLGQNPQTPQLPTQQVASAAPIGPPPAPDIPTSAASGLNLGPAAGVPAGASSMGSPALIQQAIQTAMGGQSANPFATFGA